MATYSASECMPAGLAGQTEARRSSITLSLLGGILLFAFVPLSFEAIAYGDLNLSRIPLFAFCVFTFLCFMARFEADVLSALLLILALSATQFVGLHESLAGQKTFVMPLFFLTSMLLAPAVTTLVRAATREALERLIPRLVNGILAFLMFECVTRLIFSPYMPVTSESVLEDSFYMYKFSLFFFDSNFVGIELLCLLAVMFAFKDRMARHQWVLAYLLLIASLSRASMAAAVCQLMLYKLWRWRGRAMLTLTVSVVIVFAKMISDYTTDGPDISNGLDGSLATKFLLFNFMTNLYEGSSLLQKLCGVSAGNFVNLTGSLSAHSIIGIFVIEFGVLGSILFVLFAWIFARKCPVCVYLLIIPVVVNGISLVSAAAMPFFFASLGLLGALRGSARDGRGKRWNQPAAQKPLKA